MSRQQTTLLIVVLAMASLCIANCGGEQKDLADDSDSLDVGTETQSEDIGTGEGEATDEGSEEDTGEGSDEDTGEGGIACSVDIGMQGMNLATFTGTCQDGNSQCDGGYVDETLGNPQGDCTGDLLCCVDNDQCQENANTSNFVTLGCQTEECGEIFGFPAGFQAGCPDSGYCCADMGGVGGGGGGQ